MTKEEMMGGEAELKTIGPVASMLGIDRWKLAYLIERGEVPDASVKVPGRRLFTQQDVRLLRRALAARQPPEGSEAQTTEAVKAKTCEAVDPSG